MLDVPHMSLSVDNAENCDYTNFVLDSKNCYLLYGGGKNEGVLFSDFMNGSTYCIDASFCANCELCYEVINCDGCFSCQYCINCTNCSNCIGCTDCFGCKFCINCTDLENAEYCIDNRVVSKETYSDYIASLNK